jgi:PqqD family protein of HPr-rel-A system
VTAPIRPKMRDDLTVVELDGEAVIYDDRSGDLHHLNATAMLVAELCDGAATVGELTTDISRAFGVPEIEIERQIRILLRRLRRAGLLAGHRASVNG